MHKQNLTRDGITLNRQRRWDRRIGPIITSRKQAESKKAKPHYLAYTDKVSLIRWFRQSICRLGTSLPPQRQSDVL